VGDYTIFKVHTTGIVEMEIWIPLKHWGALTKSHNAAAQNINI
jgi:hypothetical protein